MADQANLFGKAQIIRAHDCKAARHGGGLDLGGVEQGCVALTAAGEVHLVLPGGDRGDRLDPADHLANGFGEPRGRRGEAARVRWIATAGRQRDVHLARGAPQAAHPRRREGGERITSTPSGSISSRHCRCVSAMLASISTGTRGSAPEALAAI